MVKKSGVPQTPVDSMGAECFLPRIITHGSTLVSAGSEYIIVTHGCCGFVPEKVFLQPLDDLGGRNPYPDTFNTTTFQLHIDGEDFANDHSVWWMAIVW